MTDRFVDEVTSKFYMRSAIGRAKYGVTLERDDLDFTDWLIHLQEEMMDATLYLQRLLGDSEAPGLVEQIKELELENIDLRSRLKVEEQMGHINEKSLTACENQLFKEQQVNKALNDLFDAMKHARGEA